jgi:mono/diheme cytochrome c family protein
LLIPGLALLASPAVAPADPAVFNEQVRPFLESFCLDCHDADKPKADVNLEQFLQPEHMWRNPKLWEKVLTQLEDKVMPPAKKRQPDDAARAQLATWLRATLKNPDEKQLPRDPGRNVIHRLSRLEYNCTIRDLLGVDTRPADTFPPDAGGGAGFDNNAATLFIPPVLMEKYLETAGSIINAAKPELLFTKRPEEGCSEEKAARESLSTLGTRAFRRPLVAGEDDRLIRIYTASRERGESWEDGVKLAAKAILVSPHFLFRIEEERAGASEPYRIDQWELASRLSYFLWSSMPDAELFQLAKDGRLHETPVLEGQVRRMLADEKAKTFAENFAAQWLRTKELKDVVAPAMDKFPQFTDELRAAFYAEPIEFFRATLLENRPVTDFLNANYVFVNESLAKFYGIPDVTGPQMRRVEISDRNRGGLLGMGGILTLTSYPRRTSPVLRGKWVMEEILGTPPPPPPPLVDTKKVERRGDGQSFRKRLEEHREDPNCAGCHARMDPLGFGLENFDAIGAWRTQERDQPVDASGQLVSGEKFTGPAEMKVLLLQKKDEFTCNVAEKMLAYALGRGLEPTDWWPVQQIARNVAANEYRAQTLVLEVVKSFPFQYRRPTTAATVAQTNQ